MSKSVVVTGASTGIGRGCALYLDNLGFQVFAGVRKLEDAASLRQAGSDRLQPILLDVTDADMIASAGGDVARVLGSAGLGGLVNNAGIAEGGPLEFVPIETVRKQLEVNVIGQVAVTQAFLPLLRQASGRVVNVGSIGGRVAQAILGPYAMSKFALEAFSDSLRRELEPWGLHVALIEPGGIDTPIWDKAKRKIDAMTDVFSAEALALYEPQLKRFMRWEQRSTQHATPVDDVSRVIHHALTAKRPRTRYVVGRQAKIAAVLSRVLSDRRLDALLRKA